MISFLLGKLLLLLVYPLSQSFGLCFIALILYLLKQARLAVWLLVIAILWLYVCSTASFAGCLMRYLEDDFPPRAMAVIEPADAIVLLGGAMRGDTHMSTRADLNEQADRLVHAVALYKAQKAPYIMLAGGSPAGGRSEALQMRDLLVVMGVAYPHMIMERSSRNTKENADNIAKVLKQRGWQRILLVTSAFHMRRAVPLFKAQGIQVVPAPTDYQRLAAKSVFPGWLPSVGNLARTTHALHEIVGYWVYRWRGWL